MRAHAIRGLCDAPREGTIEKKLRSALRRLAVTLPFFAVAGLVLTLFGRPREATELSPVVLILTTAALHPAFDALESWNDAHGCPARVITLDARSSEADWAADLSGRFPENEIRGLLLGGDRAQVPGVPEERDPPSVRRGGAPPVVSVPLTTREPGLRGVPILRAPVRDLAEAWEFVEACRASGQTLDRLLAAESASTARERAGPTPADLAAVARPR